MRRCDLGGDLIEPYWEKASEQAAASAEGPPAKRTRGAKKKHIGAEAARLGQAASGDFRIEEAEKKALKFKCQTLKEEQYAEKKRTTAGGLFMVSVCGLFVGVRELYGSESLTQVHLFLLELFAKHRVAVPTVLAYDDACRVCLCLEPVTLSVTLSSSMLLAPDDPAAVLCCRPAKVSSGCTALLKPLHSVAPLQGEVCRRPLPLAESQGQEVLRQEC